MTANSLKIVLFLSEAILLTGCGNTPGHPEGKSLNTAAYNEPHRPQFHFSPPKGWMNDPNGLVWFDGEYHLFYQHFPDSAVGGPMHWGHAVSTDLFHWKNLPIALFPDSLGYIFSGSAVADTRNSSGFGTGDKIPLVAIYALHDPLGERAGRIDYQNQALAYSLDKGRTWTKYSGNPVLKNPGIRDFRDPKVFWHDQTGKWIMILAVHDKIHLYSSPDLKNWTFESQFGQQAGAHGGVWECPDLFPLMPEGKELTKWVMLVSINPGGPNGGSATQYFTGDFDGHNFVADNLSERWVDYGPDNYAGVTWSGIPSSDGRRLFLGWMSNWNYAGVVPASLWRGTMTTPRELSLRSVKGGYVLMSNPVRELEALRIATKSAGFQLDENSNEEEILDDSFDMSKCELVFDFDFKGTSPDTLRLVLENSNKEKLTIGLSFVENNLFVDRSSSGEIRFSDGFGKIARAPYKPDKTLKLRLLLDASSVEIFADGGSPVLTALFFTSEEFTNLKLFSKGGSSITGSCKFHELADTWHSGS